MRNAWKCSETTLPRKGICFQTDYRYWSSYARSNPSRWSGCTRSVARDCLAATVPCPSHIHLFLRSPTLGCLSSASLSRGIPAQSHRVVANFNTHLPHTSVHAKELPVVLSHCSSFFDVLFSFAALRELMLLLQVILLSLMPLIYYYKVSHVADCNCGRSATVGVQDKFRAQRVGRISSGGSSSKLSIDQQADDLPKKGQSTSPGQKQWNPAFVPEFHGFEMFVWSLLSHQVLQAVIKCRTTQMTLAFRFHCSIKSRGLVK